MRASGLAKVGVIAVDGTKVQANARRNENLDYEQIAREILEEANATDAAEDELYGDARGDELPRGVRDRRGAARLAARSQAAPGGRARARIRSRCRATGRSGSGRPSAAWRRSCGPRCRANGPMRPSGRAGVLRDGRRMAAGTHRSPTRRRRPRRAGSTSPTPTHASSKGCAASSGLQRPGRHQRAPDRHRRRGDDRRPGLRAPGTDARRRPHRTRGGRRHRHPEVVLADAGYWHQQQMERIVDRGIEVLIPPDASRRKAPGRAGTAAATRSCASVLATERGGELYRKRQPMIEPVFGQTKFNRGIDRFQRRGRAAVRTEWRLITATHNLLKLHRHTPRDRLRTAGRPRAAAPARAHADSTPRRQPPRLTRQPRLQAEARASHACDSLLASIGEEA